MLKHEAMAADEWHDNGPQNLVTVSLCIEIGLDKNAIVFEVPAHTISTHIHTATLGHILECLFIASSTWCTCVPDHAV